MEQQGYSLLNPGGSLNFEIPVSAIQLTHEEDDAVEEEGIKEKELQDLLTNAFDDLIDDDFENEEDRSSFIHGQNSYYSDSYFPESRWETVEHTTPAANKIIPENKNVPDGNERSVKFLQQSRDACQNEVSHESESDSRHSQATDQDTNWEHQYYLDHWIENVGEHSVLNVSTANKVVKDGQGNCGQVLACVPVDVVENGVVDTVEHSRSGNEMDHKAEDDKLQGEILVSNGVAPDLTAEIKQLRVLYAARGREIERLEHELDASRSKADKEFEILKRYLAKANNEKEEYAASLHESRSFLTVANHSVSRLEGEARSLGMQLKSIADNRDELLQKLQAAESTIENLHSQLKELSKSENLVRAREQHTSIMNSVRERHNNELYKLKVEIDELKESVGIKCDELEATKKELAKLGREWEDVKVEKAETVNRLIRALEESQRECQMLVKSGATEHSGDDSEAVKSLKEQLKETRRELQLYISAAELQILNLKETTSNKPPETLMADKSLKNQDGLVNSLKSEVERSLACLNAKNQQLANLQLNYQSAVSKARLLEEKCQFSEQELGRAQANIQKLAKGLEAAKSSPVSESDTFKARAEILEKENVTLKEEVRGKQQLVEDLMAEKQELATLVQQLKAEMTNLAMQCEVEGQKAVEACRDACLELHEQAMGAKKNELLEQLQLIQQEYMSEVEKLSQELDDVKDVYVKVCGEKNGLEERLHASWNALKAKEIEDLKSALSKEKQFEVSALKEELLRANNRLADEKKELRKEYDRHLSERIQQVRHVWLKEQDLVIQEKVLAKVKEQLHNYMSEKSHDATNEDANDYVEQIHLLEKRVQESEHDWKRQVADLKAKLNEEKAKAVAEASLEKDKYYQEKIEALLGERAQEKEAIVIETEAKIASELESFLKEQKERFLMVLKSMQESHTKEKNNLLSQCEEKLIKLKDEYQKLLEAQCESQRHEKERQALTVNERVEKLRNSLAELEERLRVKEKEKSELALHFQKVVKERTDELQDARLEMEQRSAEAARNAREAGSVVPATVDVAGLKADLEKAEEVVVDARNKLEAEEQKHGEVAAKYRTLKDKVKKYHRYIHSKEKEFADTLAVLVHENNRVPERIAVMKNDVVGILNCKLEELQRQFLKELPAGCIDAKGNPTLVVSKDVNTKEKIKVTYNNYQTDDAITANLRLQFVDSIQKIHSEVMTFLEDCSRKATLKIHEDVATATWLLAERLDLTRTSKEALLKDGGGGGAVPPLIRTDATTRDEVLPPNGGRSAGRASVSPATTMTNGSSGHGTMADNPSSAAKSLDVIRGVTVQTSDSNVMQFLRSTSAKEGPVKSAAYWASTPFNLDVMNRINLDTNPSIGISTDYSLIPKISSGLTKVRILSPTREQIGKGLPSPSPPVYSLSTGTWHSQDAGGAATDQGAAAEALPEREPQQAAVEASCSAPFQPLTPIFDSTEDLRKSLFKTFVSELAQMKSTFWQSIESSRKSKCPPDDQGPTKSSKSK